MLPHVSQAEEPRAEMPVVLPTLFGEGYGTYHLKPEPFLLSFLIHTLVLIIVLTSGTYVIRHRQQIHQQFTTLVTDVGPYVLPPAPTKARGGGGGGDRDKLQASKRSKNVREGVT